MDWLNQLESETVVLVPTRSLANNLVEGSSQYQIEQGNTAWLPPNILVWSDFVHQLWSHNRLAFSQSTGVHTLLSAQQSLLIFTQIVDASRRHDKDLLLLNVAHTASAIQRSWQLMNEWSISTQQIANLHLADCNQYANWIEQYLERLQKRGFIDLPFWQSKLVNLYQSDAYHRPYKRIICYAFDLLNQAQKNLLNQLQKTGTQVEYKEISHSELSCEYQGYQHQDDEVRAALMKVRNELEQGKISSAGVVVPDLQSRLSRVQSIAREVFYPDLSPLKERQNPTVYRFSLGQNLRDWAAIEVGYQVLTSLRGQIKTNQLEFILRSQYLRALKESAVELSAFRRFCRQQRIDSLVPQELLGMLRSALEDEALKGRSGHSESSGLEALFSQLGDQHQKLQQLLAQRKQDTKFASPRFSQWAEVFAQWLQVWGWSCGSGLEMNSTEYQLNTRWNNLLKEFAQLDRVQNSVGLVKALEVLRQMIQDAVFLPKAAASPVFISGVFEAIGRPTELLIVTGMSDDYPGQPNDDPFIPAGLLKEQGHPNATPQAYFDQAKQVTMNLMLSAKRVIISYSKWGKDDTEILHKPTALFNDQLFVEQTLGKNSANSTQLDLQLFQDAKGSAFTQSNKVSAAVKLFVDQSNCEFKAYATHRLKFEQLNETEFGLDRAQQGSVAHKVLEEFWLQLGSSQRLKALSEQELDKEVMRATNRAFELMASDLPAKKRVLLEKEMPRYKRLLLNWLKVEKARPLDFEVMELEQKRTATVAGITFSYITDRLDVVEDGRSLLIDYKTGQAARRNWLGDRLSEPQMPLYSVALDQQKKTPLSGIAVAKLHSQPGFEELATAGMIRADHYANKHEQLWLENQPKWQGYFEQLADRFLAGHAEVNPIDENTCRYCELASFCRVSQIVQQSNSK